MQNFNFIITILEKKKFLERPLTEVPISYSKKFIKKKMPTTKSFLAQLKYILVRNIKPILKAQTQSYFYIYIYIYIFKPSLT